MNYETHWFAISKIHWTWIFISLIVAWLSGGNVSANSTDVKIVILPFIPAEGNKTEHTVIAEVSTKLSQMLNQSGIVVLPILRSQKKSTASLPQSKAFQDTMNLYRLGRDLMRNKKYEAAKDKLEEALQGIEQHLPHLQDFSTILDLYRLLGLCYFHLGLGEQGENAIQHLGVLAPTRKYPVTTMPAAIRRILDRSQKQALSSTNELHLTVPENTTVQFNDQKLAQPSSPVIIKGLSDGKHYLWVRKKGYYPFAQVVVAGKGKNNIQVRLKPLPSASGPDYSTHMRQIHHQIVKGKLNETVRSNVQEIASGLQVNYLIFGYFLRDSNKNKLMMFLYRTNDGSLKKYPPVDFDLDLLEVDIRTVTLARDLKTAFQNFDTLPTQPWQQQSIFMASAPSTPPPARTDTPPPARTDTPPPARTDTPPPARTDTPPPARTGVYKAPSSQYSDHSGLGDDNPDLDGVEDSTHSKRGIVVVQPTARPQPKPQPEVTPPPARPSPQPQPVDKPQPRTLQQPPSIRTEQGIDEDELENDLHPTNRRPPPKIQSKAARMPTPSHTEHDHNNRDPQQPKHHTTTPVEPPHVKPRTPEVEPPHVKPRTPEVEPPHVKPRTPEVEPPHVKPRTPVIKDNQDIRTKTKDDRLVARTNPEPDVIDRSERRDYPAQSKSPDRPFDPDLDIDWSNPIPQEASPGYRPDRHKTESRDDTRHKWRSTLADRRRGDIGEPQPSHIKPPSRRVAPDVRDDRDRLRHQDTPKKDSLDHKDRDWDTKIHREPIPKPPITAKPKVSQTWWFWTIIGVSTAAVAGTITAFAIIHSQPATAYNIYVNTNPTTN